VEATRQEAETIARVNASLAQAVDEQEILSAIAVLAEPYGVSLSSLSYTRVDGNNKPIGGEVVAIRSGDGQPIAPSSWGVTYFPNEHFPVADLLYSSQDHLFFIEDALTDPRLESDQIRHFLQSIHQPAFISMVLKTGSQWQGIITFAWSAPHKFNREIRALMAAVLPTAAAVVSSRRLYLQTMEHVKRLREMDTLKNEFLSNMSHELRTPLNAIIGLSDVILAGLNGPISARLEHDVQTIFNSGQQLLTIVNDVLDIAKIEAGVLTLSRHSVELPEVILAGLDTVRVVADDKGVQIKSTIPSNLPLVWADKHRVQQVVNNLLANAVKFTDEGTVEVTAYTEDNKVIFCVKDEGIGIKPADHEMIFHQFRQVEGSIARKKGGAGLGLPISKRLVELHGGSMWLQSDLGMGSSFYFSLPVFVQK
jgi:signal transduction histidine kinase